MNFLSMHIGEKKLLMTLSSSYVELTAPAHSCRSRGSSWKRGVYRPGRRGCASWSFPPKPCAQHVVKASGHRSVRLIPSQRLPEEWERKRQLTASSWLPVAGVKEQDSFTPPPFPLKIPQARSCLAGACEGKVISTLCFLLIWGD